MNEQTYIPRWVFIVGRTSECRLHISFLSHMALFVECFWQITDFVATHLIIISVEGSTNFIFTTLLFTEPVRKFSIPNLSHLMSTSMERKFLWIINAKAFYKWFYATCLCKNVDKDSRLRGIQNNSHFVFWGIPQMQLSRYFLGYTLWEKSFM